MPDPSYALPLELWSMVMALAIDKQRAGPLEFLMVSRRWAQLLLATPFLWSQIYIQNEEDELARVSTFLHLSRRCPLHVDIMTVIPTVTSVQLIAEHVSRVRTISIRPGAVDTATTLHTDLWKQAVSHILETLFNGHLPSDIENTSCFGISLQEKGQLSYHIILMHFTVAHNRNRIVPAYLSQKVTTFGVWDEHISSVVRASAKQDSQARAESIYSIGEHAPYAQFHAAITIALPSFILLLKDHDHSVRSATIDTLNKFAAHAELHDPLRHAIPSLFELLRDGNRHVRVGAIKAIIRLADHAGLRQAIGAQIRSLIQLLEDGEWDVRFAIVSALGNLAKHADVRLAIGTAMLILIKLLRHENQGVRWVTVKAIDKLADHIDLLKEIGASIQSLIKLLEEEDGHVRLDTVKVIAKLVGYDEHSQATGVVIPLLIKLLEDGESDVRLAAVSALSELSCHVDHHQAIGASIPSLISLLEDSGSLVRSAALSALGQLASHPDFRQAIGAAIPMHIKLQENEKWDGGLAPVSYLGELSEHSGPISGWVQEFRMEDEARALPKGISPAQSTESLRGRERKGSPRSRDRSFTYPEPR